MEMNGIILECQPTWVDIQLDSWQLNARQMMLTVITLILKSNN